MGDSGSTPILLGDLTQSEADWAYLVGRVAEERDNAQQALAEAKTRLHKIATLDRVGYYDGWAFATQLQFMAEHSLAAHADSEREGTR